MKRFLPFCFLLLLSLPAFALDDGHAKYVGGTVPGVDAGVIGRLDTTSETSLIFLQAGNKIEIPYAAIESYQYSTEVSAHLGMSPAIAVRLVKRRRHSHFFRISYRGQDSAVQVVVLEVPNICRARWRRFCRLDPRAFAGPAILPATSVARRM